MSPLARVYMSYNRLEWWNGHLAKALSRQVDVVERQMVRDNQQGYAVQADIRTLVDGPEPVFCGYLGSVDQLFLGIADLPLTTGIWTDVIGSSLRPFLPCLRLFDVVFCSQKDSVAAVRDAGNAQVAWLPFAFDTSLRNEPETRKVYDVGFVGNLALPATKAERLGLLTRLERRYTMNDYRTPVYGDAMMRVYNQSRIVVNIPVPGGFNMRTFEAMAAGALLLTKAVGNGQADLFTDGIHLVTYRDADDLTDKIDYFLRHERERSGIAEAGMREVLAHHTYDHRAARVLEMLASASRCRARERPARVDAYSAFYEFLGRSDLLGGLACQPGVRLATRARLMGRAGRKLWRHVREFRRRGGVGGLVLA